MKKSLILTVMLAVMSMFVVGSVYGDMVIYDGINGEWKKPISLYYGAAWNPNPTPGHAGIEVDADFSFLSAKCSEFSVVEDIGWFQIGSQHNGGEGSCDMTGYTGLKIKVAANPAKDNVIFGMGGDDGAVDSCKQTEEIDLSAAAWTDATLDLSGKNMSGITNMFWISAGGADINQKIYVAEATYLGGTSGQIIVTITGATGVAIDGTIDLGSVNPGGNVEGGTLTVTNTGTAVEDFWLSVSGLAGWTLITSGAPQHNQYKLYAAFDANGEAIPWSDANHALSNVPEICTATRFAGNDSNGIGVAIGGTRSLYVNFFSPSSTSATEQKMFIVVGCSVAP